MTKPRKPSRHDVELVMCPHPDGSGQWYWCLRISQSVYEEGLAPNSLEAMKQVIDAHIKWEKTIDWVSDEYLFGDAP